MSGHINFCREIRKQINFWYFSYLLLGRQKPHRLGQRAWKELFHSRVFVIATCEIGNFHIVFQALTSRKIPPAGIINLQILGHMNSMHWSFCLSIGQSVIIFSGKICSFTSIVKNSERFLTHCWHGKCNNLTKFIVL